MPLRFNRFSFYLFVGVFVLMSSCTVQKRLHNTGYSIVWNKKYATKHTDSTPNQLLSSTTVDIEKSSVVIGDVDAVRSIQSDVNLLDDVEKQANELNEAHLFGHHDEISEDRTQTQENDGVYEGNEEETDAHFLRNKIGFAFSTVSVVTGILGVVAGIMGFVGGWFSGAFALLALILGILTLVFGILGYRFSSPENNWGQKGGIAGIVLGGLTLLLGVIGLCIDMLIIID